MWYNKWIMIPLLKSPLHFFISSGMMLIEYVGCKSGKRFAVPVNYIEIENAYYAISKRERVWWRNMRGGAEVTLRVKGKALAAQAELHETHEAATAAYSTYFKHVPRMAKYFQIGQDAEGQPNAEDVARVAGEWVVIVFEPS